MWWLVLPLEFLVVLGVCAAVYYELGSYRKRPIFVTVLTLFGWSLSGFLVFLVPNDIVSTDLRLDCGLCDGDSSSTSSAPSSSRSSFSALLTNDSSSGSDTQCQSSSEIVLSHDVLIVLWNIVYWTSFLLTWLVYPLLQTYSMAGEFTIITKIRATLIENVLLYTAMGVVAGIAAIIFAVQSNLGVEQMMGVAIALANAWGLFVLIMMMGYGLVQIPRKIWWSSNREMQLKRYQFNVVSLSQKLDTYRAKYNTVRQRIKAADESIHERDPFRPFVEQIIAELPEEDYADWVVSDRIEETYSEKQLVKLHTRTMDIVRYKQRTETLLHTLHESAFVLEDVLRAAESRSWAAARIEWSFGEPRSHRLARVFDRIEYVWKMYLEVPLLKVLSVLAMVMSAAVVWSECTFWSTEVGSRPDLSPFSQLLRIPGLGLVGTMFFIFVPISYMALCAFYSLFKLRLFNYYHIIPHHQTDSNSLLFSAAWLCRLTAPLAFNFLLLVHKFDCTAFSVVLSSMNIVPVVGNTFNWFFPALLTLLCVSTFFNLGGRVLSLLKIKRFQFTDTFNDTQIEEGRDLLARERRRRTHGSHSLGGGSSEFAALRSTSRSTSVSSLESTGSLLSSSTRSDADRSSSTRVTRATTAVDSDLSDSSEDERQSTFGWFTSRVAGAVQSAGVAGRRALHNIRGRDDAHVPLPSRSSRGRSTELTSDSELMPWPTAAAASSSSSSSSKTTRSSYQPSRAGSRFTVTSNPWEDELETTSLGHDVSIGNSTSGARPQGGSRFEPLILDDL
mmetsp:Transcript_6882/g.17357  ORF Transcript_6882/g.17357 Transcript_6882/m.17357 type:complete len:785 (+) Transcript_6882:126-2480(+)